MIAPRIDAVVFYSIDCKASFTACQACFTMRLRHFREMHLQAIGKISRATQEADCKIIGNSDKETN